MAPKENNIELRSNEIQDILGKVPPVLIRIGITMISLVIVLLLLIAVWFKYPDRIVSSIQLTTENPPVYLVSRTTAKIVEFFAAENKQVEPGELLVVLESGANYRDVLEARDLVSDLNIGPDNPDTSLLYQIQGLKELNLGNLQGEFAALQKSVQELLEFLQFDKYAIRIKGKQEEARSQRIHYNRLYEQKLNKEKELVIADKQFKRNQELHRDGTISDLQLEESNQNYLSQKSQFEQARLDMSDNSIIQGQIEQDINELMIDQREEELSAYARILENKDRFLSAMSDWEQKYLMISPAKGLVSLSKYWSVNQEVPENTRVLAIVQETTGPILGKLLIPSAGAGKVELGQNVIVRFDRYPYMEFGMVSGVVKNISVVPEETNYFVEVAFPDGLNTSYNQELEFTQEMTGQAEIITENRSFLVRVITPLKSMLKRNSLGRGNTLSE